MVLTGAADLLAEKARHGRAAGLERLADIPDNLAP
jgi:hypothetical protein